MLRIIGFPIGMMNFNFIFIIITHIIIISNLNFRTKQEEARTFWNNKNNVVSFEDIVSTSSHFYDTPSILSTELCIYIQGTFIAAIFIIGITR